MSDYCRTKGVFYPITEEDLKSIGLTDTFYFELDPRFKDLFEHWNPRKRKDYFDTVGMIDYSSDDSKVRYYLVYVLFDSYGDESSEFGMNRELKPAEQDKYEQIFKQIFPNVDKNKFKYVDYCYYNCCEPNDYYLHTLLEEDI